MEERVTVRKITLGEEHKNNILGENDQFRLFADKLPTDTNEFTTQEWRQQLFEKLGEPQHKMEASAQNIELSRPGQVHLFVNGSEVDEDSHCIDLEISERTLKFDGEINELTILLGSHPLGDSSFVIQFIDAAVDSTEYIMINGIATIASELTIAPMVDEVESLEVTLSLKCPVRMTRIQFCSCKGLQASKLLR